MLFDRNPHRVTLTEAGALLLEHARGVLDRADAAREAMRRIRPGASGVLRAGVPPDTTPRALMTLVAEFTTRVPDVLLELHELTTAGQLAKLRAEELDAGLVRHPCDTVGLESSRVVHRPLGVVLPAGHPAAEQDVVRLRTLDCCSLVIFPREMAPQLYDHVLEACRDHGFLPSAIRHARNPHFVHGLVMSGLGAHLNEEPIDELPAGLVWRPIDEPRRTWSTSAVWPPVQGGEVVAAFAEAALAGLRSVGHA